MFDLPFWMPRWKRRYIETTSPYYRLSETVYYDLVKVCPYCGMILDDPPNEMGWRAYVPPIKK